MITQPVPIHPLRRCRLLTLSGATTAILLFLLLLVNGARAEPTVPDAPGSLHGQVRDAAGQPLTGTIHVALYAHPFQITNTNGFLQANLLQVATPDAAGFYTFTSLPSGVYRVGFSDPGTSACAVGACDACTACLYRHYAGHFYSNTSDLSSAQDLLVMGTQITGIDATMQPGGALTGTVTLSGAVDTTGGGQVTLYRHTADGWQMAETAERLTYATPTLPPEPASIAFRFSGLAPGIYRLCATLRHVAPDTYGEVVFLWTGCYQRSAVGPATSSMLDDRLGLEPISSATDITVTAAVTLTELNIVVKPFLPTPLPEQPGIRGKVTTTAGGPLPGVRVTAYLSQSTGSHTQVSYAYTNQFGDYRLPLTTGGRYVLHFSTPTAPDALPDYLPSYYQGASEFAQAALLAWQPGQTLPNIDVTLLAWAAITGTVKLQGGYMAEWFTFAVYGKGDTGWTLVKTLHSFCTQFCAGAYNRQTGAYRLRLEPGVYRIAATAQIKGQHVTAYYGGPTLAQATDLVIQAEEQRGAINLTLDAEQAETSLRGQVKVDDAPRAGVRVEVYNASEARPFVYVTTDADGNYAVTGLLAGQYLVRALAPEPSYASVFFGGQPVWWAAPPIPITLEAPGIAVDLSLSHAGALAGTLLRFDGQPLRDATVWVYWYRGEQGWEEQPPVVATATDAQGQWAIQGLLPGVYRVRYRHPDFWPSAIPHGTRDKNSGGYTPSDLPIKPDAVTDAAMWIDATFLRTPTPPDGSAEQQKLFLPLTRK